VTNTVTPALAARTDRTLIRPNGRSVRYVLAQVTAPSAPAVEGRRERLPVNLAFVLDRSGSMSGAKITLAKQTIAEALHHLDARDRFSIVVYDDLVDLVVESTPATAHAKRDALGRLDPVDARGSTNLSGGWLRGCEQVAALLQADGVNRTLLLTDGLANRGETDPDALAHHAGELRARGVSTSTFGIGADFDESLLQRMADAGGGHFYYVHDAATIRDHVTSEVGETLEVVARDAAIEVLTAEELVVDALSPHDVRRAGARSLVLLGDLVAEQAVDVVLRLTFPFGDVGRQAGAILTLRDRDGVFAADGRTGAAAGAADPKADAPEARLTWTYADNAANDAQPRDPVVDRAVATQYAARARQEAVHLNRAGDYDAARRALQGVARRIRDYAGSDPVLRGLVHDLEGDLPALAAAMPEANRKQMHFASANMARHRDAFGRSIKGR
jgi:Ca-activated chloride channel family protein